MSDRQSPPGPDAGFYIGYLPQAPGPLGRWLRAAALLLLLGSAAAAVVLASVQPRDRAARFEFGTVRDFSGRLLAEPYPMLQLDPAAAPALLVAEGKHGLDAGTLAGRRVALRGTLIHRDGHTAIEVVDGTLHATDAPGSEGPAPVIDLGPVHAVGELVDSKCFLGVMVPGQGKVHRSCAARCISGGIPPSFLTRDEGVELALLATASDGSAIAPEQILAHVGEPVEVRGRLVEQGGLRTLRLDLGSLRPVDNQVPFALERERR